MIPYVIKAFIFFQIKKFQVDLKKKSLFKKNKIF